MGVIIGSARSSFGNTTRGDQHGGDEVSTQAWYKHSKGWRCFRAKDPVKRGLLARAMEAACKNNKIGYSQPDRLALFNQVKGKGYDPALATEATNCDCSSLVRVCCYYAGIQPKNFITSNEASALLATGAFTEMKDSKYTTKQDYLCAGDILVTKTKGHTVIVITSGSKCEEEVRDAHYGLGDRVLSNGCEGDDVKELQTDLIELGFPCGDYGIDGEFGDCTEQAVIDFQRSIGLQATGIVDAQTAAKIEQMMGAESSAVGTSIAIKGGNCYVRKEPNTKGAKIGVAYKGKSYLYAGQTSVEGWVKIVFKGTEGWVSGKYASRS